MAKRICLDPLFILAAQAMNASTISQKLFDFCNRLMGHIPGRLGHVNIPLENLKAYFDARVRHGFTHEGWQKGDLEKARSLIG